LYVAALVLGSAALAASLPGPSRSFFLAHFKATIKGEQRTTWTKHHVANPSSNACDYADVNGSGSQLVTFKSRAVNVVQVVGTGGGKAGFLPAGGRGPSSDLLIVNGSRTRSGTLTPVAVAPNPGCGGGEGLRLSPDCGTKELGNWGLDLAYERSDEIALELGEIRPLGGAFEFMDCPLEGPDAFGTLPVETTLPVAMLRSRKHRKIIVIANNTKEKHEADGDWTTKLHWQLTLRRAR
jgi:hypothetical protein